MPCFLPFSPKKDDVEESVATPIATPTAAVKQPAGTEIASTPKGTNHVAAPADMSSRHGYDGLNIAQKMVFFGILVGCMAMYIKMRNRGRVLHEKYTV